MGKLPKHIMRMKGLTLKQKWAKFRGQRRSKGRRVKVVRANTRASKQVRKVSKNNMSAEMATFLGGLIYGAGREYVSDKLAPLTSRIPAGEVADEVGMGVLSWLLMRRKIPLLNKLPVIQKAGRVGLGIESARIGQFAVDRMQQRRAAATTSAGAGQAGLLF